MTKYIAVIILLCFGPVAYAQKRPQKNEKVYIYVDPCAVPQKALPKKDNTANKTRSAANNLVKRPALRYPSPRLSVKIKLIETTVKNVKDLRFKLTLSNNLNYSQTFLFDKIDGAFPFLFGTYCKITNAKDEDVLIHHNRAILDTASYYKHIESYYYTLQSSEWLIKEFNVTNLCVFDSSICRKGRLPAGKYSFQINFQDNPSNEVSFFAE